MDTKKNSKENKKDSPDMKWGRRKKRIKSNPFNRSQNNDIERWFWMG